MAINKQVTKNGRPKPPVYPRMRRMSLLDILKSPDLWWGIYFFVLFQASLYLIAVGGMAENSTPWTVGGIALGIFVVTHGLMQSTKRQMIKIRYDLPSIGKMAGMVLLAYVLIYAISWGLLYIGIMPTVQPNQEVVVQIMQRQALPMLFITCIVAPVAEELVFREYLPYAGGASMVSFVISSLLFTMLHAPAGLSGWLTYGVMSAVFLHLRLKGNNIKQAIGGHMLYNIISTALGFL